ncbi:unnamed protein product [Boreogadus saida]
MALMCRHIGGGAGSASRESGGETKGLQSTMDEEIEEGGPTSKTTLSGEHGRRSKAKSQGNVSVFGRMALWWKLLWWKITEF